MHSRHRACCPDARREDGQGCVSFTRLGSRRCRAASEVGWVVELSDGREAPPVMGFRPQWVVRRGARR